MLGNLKKYFARDKLIYLILVAITITQFFVYLFSPDRYELGQARDAVLGLVTDGASSYTASRSGELDPGNVFAKKVDIDIPKTGIILFVNDSTDGTEMEKYLKISLRMPTARKVLYEFRLHPSEQEVVEMMTRRGADYLVTYSNLVPFSTNTLSEIFVGRLYRLDGAKLVPLKEYK